MSSTTGHLTPSGADLHHPFGILTLPASGAASQSLEDAVRREVAEETLDGNLPARSWPGLHGHGLRLPLARYRDIPAFLRATMVIRKQLAGAKGLIGYSLDARLTKKTFWTLSAWDGQNALDAFSHADPHRSRVNAIRPHMQPTTFRFWTVRGADLPVSWDEARRRIAPRTRPTPTSRDTDPEAPWRYSLEFQATSNR